ncbi:MAG: HdeD family acid-resistance protein [Alphaproteobacteria bacterium]|nr:HdeD family acid-resistance protein [Alphaproteobacteria bacterium]
MSQVPELPGLPASPRTVHDHWGWFLVEGCVLTVLGGAAIVLPTVASLATTILFGWLLMIGGLVGLLSSWSARNAPGRGWALVSAMLAIVAGGALIWFPIAGLMSLTLVLAAFLTVDGVVSILYALDHRRHESQRWAFLLVNGVLDIALAMLILWWLPGSAAWILGLVLGIDLVFAGVSLVAMALAARKLPQ